MNARRPLPLAAFAAITLAASTAHAQAPRFSAQVDSSSVPVGESFTYEVTLTLGNGSPESYTPPDFQGVRVLGTSPSRSTQIQMSGGSSFVQTAFTWRYELAAIEKGTLVIRPARVRVDGRDLATRAVTVTITDRQSARAPSSAGAAPGGGAAASGRGSFLLAVPDKTRAYVGEQVNVTWKLFLAERPENFQATAEPTTEGFWSEALPVPSNRGLALTQEEYQGEAWEVAVVARKALFALRPGKHTVGAMDAQISSVSFFTGVRSRRLRAEPFTIEALPLPTEGRPASFDASAPPVGRFELEARVDRPVVAVGEPATVSIKVKGVGNIRQVRAPRVPVPEGWKAYEPKVEATVEPGQEVTGVKSADVLLVAERPGRVTLAPLELGYFDPAKGGYVVARTEAMSIEAIPSAAATNAPAGQPAGAGAAATENVIPVEIRPLHAAATLRRDVGETLFRSRLFAYALGLPPFAYFGVVALSALRRRLAADTEGARRRRVKKLVRQRFGAAEKHQTEGRTAAAFTEIERVLRDVLGSRLGHSAVGMRMEELAADLRARGVADDLIARVVTELERCAEARFAPGGLAPEAVAEAIERAGDLVVGLERTRWRANTMEGAA